MKWNSPAGREAFGDWLLGDQVGDLLEPAEPSQISELTVVAGGFLRCREAELYSFSDEAVRSVRGTSRLDALSLAHNPAEGTFTFIRTNGPEDLRTTIRDVVLGGAIALDVAADALTNADGMIVNALIEEYTGQPQDDVPEIECDMYVRTDVLFQDAWLSDGSGVMQVWFGGSSVSVPYTEENLLVCDYMQLRNALNVEL